MLSPCFAAYRFLLDTQAEQIQTEGIMTANMGDTIIIMAIRHMTTRAESALTLKLKKNKRTKNS